MDDKFKSTPRDGQTNVKSTNVVQIGEFEAMHETWFWEGITAESLIFRNEDIAHLSKRDLEDMARDAGFIRTDSEVTFGRQSHTFTFLNFNFDY